MEFFERFLSNSRSYSGSKEHAHISNEISTVEDFLAVFLIFTVNFEFPVIGKLDHESGMIRSFNIDNISRISWT